MPDPLKISTLIAAEYLEETAKKESRKKCEKAMAKIVDVEPEEYDKL